MVGANLNGWNRWSNDIRKLTNSYENQASVIVVFPKSNDVDFDEGIYFDNFWGEETHLGKTSKTVRL